MRRGAIAGVTAKDLAQGPRRTNAGTHQEQARPRAAWGLQAGIELQGTKQPRFSLHLEVRPRKARELAEALGASLIADADRQQLDAGLLQPRQCRDQGLGVFQ